MGFRLQRTAGLAASIAPVAALLTWASPARPQAPPGPLHTKPGIEPEKPPTPEEAKRTIHVRVNEVTAPVTVRNANGEMLLDIPKESFHIFDNGGEQKIEPFALDCPRPGDQLAH